MSRGKRIVLTTFGSFGDIHPSMAVALELQSRGHHPVIATSGLYREKIEGAGLAFAPLRPDLPPPKDQDQEMMDRIMEPKSGPKYLMEELIFPYVREGYADLMQACVGADLLVTHPITFAGPLVAQVVRRVRRERVTRIIDPDSLEHFLSRLEKDNHSVLLRDPQGFPENLAADLFVDMMKNAEEKDRIERF